MKQTFLAGAFLLTGAVIALIVGYALFAYPQASYGSVPQTNEYSATTTDALSVAERTLRKGYGSLAQVTITGDNTGLMTLYNATTSNVNLRTGQKATSTIIIADFPASAPEGTYTFDAVFTDGLLLVTSGAAATSTVTWR